MGINSAREDSEGSEERNREKLCPFGKHTKIVTKRLSIGPCTVKGLRMRAQVETRKMLLDTGEKSVYVSESLEGLFPTVTWKGEFKSWTFNLDFPEKY